MGINLEKSLRISGYKATLFKDALVGFDRTKSPGNLVDLKSVFPLRRDGAIVFEECLDRGLIDPVTLRLTDAGEAISRAKAKPRTSLQQARALLEQFLDRVVALNGDPLGVHFVEQVWLFGSVLREEDSVGDIDLALTAARRPEFARDYEGMIRHLEGRLAGMAGAPATWDRNWSIERWFSDRALYGPRRHPLLAGVQDGITSLAALAVPCRLIYDRKSGGRVQRPTLPRHPDSRGRDKEIKPPSDMPDLAPLPIKPMDARWVTAYFDGGTVSPHDIFRGWNDDAHRLFLHYPDRLRVAGSEFRLRGNGWIPKRVKAGGLDGRNAIALANETAWGGTCVVLRRSIEVGPEVWVLNAEFGDLELFRTRRHIELSTLPDIVSAAALILAVDAERMLRRIAETSSPLAVEIRLSANPEDDRVRAEIVEEVAQLLKSRSVRIEPEGWEGRQVNVEVAI